MYHQQDHQHQQASSKEIVRSWVKEVKGPTARLKPYPQHQQASSKGSALGKTLGNGEGSELGETLG